MTEGTDTIEGTRQDGPPTAGPRSNTGAGAGAAVIFGATSAVAQATARQLAERGQALVLVARDPERLASLREDLRVRGGEWAAPVDTRVADLDDIEGQESLLAGLGAAVDDWYLFYARYPDQAEAERDWSLAARVLHTNFTSSAALLSRIAVRITDTAPGAASGRPTRSRIVVVSSVAGDRARQSNYIYGTSKGALSLFCQGLRNRLSHHGVQVLTVKPGFIDTPMTADVPKRPAILWATPERVASDILRAVDRGRDVVYTPWFWRYILLVIRLIPESLFKRLSL